MSLEIYNRVREVPQEAQKTIGGGRLKGMTDINPMWRIKTLTEVFGPAGMGWYYKITEKRLEPGANDEVAAFVDIELYVKHGDEWSAPIVGTGGAMFVAKEKSGPYTSDECYKMALTDAISVACKALGMGADVYWQKDRTKYDQGEKMADTYGTDREYEAARQKLLSEIANIQNLKNIGDPNLEASCRKNYKKGLHQLDNEQLAEVLEKLRAA